MIETAEQIQTPVLPESPVQEVRAQLPEPETPKPEQDETVLTAEISELWRLHTDYATSMRHQSQNLRSLRNELGKKLSDMKQVLAQPGRLGKWSGWLKERQIPRATADRLVAKYERSVHPEANCITEQITEPTDEEIKSLFDKLAPKLRKLLRTTGSAYKFIDLLTASLERVERRVTGQGILILNLAKPAQTIIEHSVPEEAQAEPVPVTADVPVESIVGSTGVSLAL